MGDTLPGPHAIEANMIAPGPRNWQFYLVLGFFQFVVSLQGNIFPFLRVELDISYRTIGLHPTAFACGIILVGLLGPRVISQFGRRRVLMVGVFGFATAAVLLCLALAASVSIASFALLGMSGRSFQSLCSQRSPTFARKNVQSHLTRLPRLPRYLVSSPLS